MMCHTPACEPIPKRVPISNRVPVPNRVPISNRVERGAYTLIQTETIMVPTLERAP